MSNSRILQRPSSAECEAEKENKETQLIASQPNLNEI